MASLGAVYVLLTLPTRSKIISNAAVSQFPASAKNGIAKRLSTYPRIVIIQYRAVRSSYIP